MRFNDDTIAAISTSVGNAGIGIIRISGKDSINIADRIIRSGSGKSLDLFSMPSHTVHYGFVMSDDKVIDEVLCAVYKSPKTYTAEDVVEINCHGGSYVLNRVLDIVLSEGARLAERGEFTKRAFLNGRIDLSQAESVMDLISSENEFIRSNSLLQLKGSVKNKINEIREKIIHESAYIEAALDDPEHYDIDESYKKRLKENIDLIIKDIDKMISDSENALVLKNGINTVITGKPNVGKSSLLNLITGYERAIVTSVPGTTRDILSEKVKLGDIILNITDTAGIHESYDEVEKIGINKAEEEIKKADLILFMMDSVSGIDENDIEILRKIDNKNMIILVNKTDAGSEIKNSEIEKMSDTKAIFISVKENKGIDELKEVINNMFIKGEISENRLYITNKRQIEELRSSKKSLLLVIDSINNKMSEDTYTIDMMDAYSHLGEIIGEDISDDLADRIFNEFCMGK